MKDFHVPESKCVYCGAAMNGALGDNDPDEPPDPGDWSMCIECGGLHVFDESLRLRMVTAEEIAAMTMEERQELTRMRGVIEAFKEHLRK